MDIGLQLEIKKRKKYYEYLMENSYWFKELNRNPMNYNNFISYVRDKYRLHITNKITDSMNNIDTMMSILDILKWNVIFFID